jgi:hypothetical protein
MESNWYAHLQATLIQFSKDADAMQEPTDRVFREWYRFAEFMNTIRRGTNDTLEQHDLAKYWVK